MIEDPVMIVDLTKGEFTLMMLLVEADIKMGITTLMRPLEGRHFMKVDTAEYVQKLKEYFIKYHTEVLINLRPLAFQNDKIQCLIPKSQITNALNACKRVPGAKLDEKYQGLYIHQYTSMTRTLQAALDYKNEEIAINQIAPSEKV